LTIAARRPPRDGWTAPAAGHGILGVDRVKSRILIGLLVILVIIAGAAALVIYRGMGGFLTAQSEVSAAPAPGQTSAAATGTTTAANAIPGGGEEVRPGVFQKLSPSPDISGVIVSDGEGADVDLGRYKGKALLINVWATWCAPCVAEMPSLNRLQSKLGSDSFAVLPIAVDEQSLDKVKAFLAEHQLDKLPALLDANHALDKVLRVAALPTSLLVSPEGKIVARFTGDNKWDCGKAYTAVETFAKTGEVIGDVLEPCAE
jgi:thiol-disulfide isomerase/thioredoxin